MRRIGVALLVLAGIAGYWWSRTYDPIGVIQDQLNAIDEGNYPRAYDYLCSMAKAKLTREDFVALIQTNSVVMEARSTSFPSRKREGPTAMISGVLIGYGQSVSEVQYVLIQENGEWRVQSFQWNSPRISAR